MNKFNCRLDTAEQRIKLEDKQISYDTSYMWNLKKKVTQMNLFTKQKQTHRHRKNLWSPQGKDRGRDKLGVWN